MALTDPIHASSPERATERITARAVVLGLVTLAISTYYQDNFAGNLIKTYFPVGVLIPFMVWVVLNTGLALLAPRYALNRVELLTILGIVWIAGSLPTVGWGLYAVSVIPAPEFFASPENSLREVVLPLLPRWLFLDARQPQIYDVYAGIPPGGSIPWSLWFRPFFWWFVGCGSVVAATLFGSAIFFRQWDEQERLTFPMATLPVDMLQTDRTGVPTVFRNNLFWLGFAVTAGIITWNIVGYWQISLPRITLFDHSSTRELYLGRYYPSLFFKVQPLLMGLAYLCPVDILFSIWFYNVLNTFKIGLLNRTGFTVGIEGQPAGAGEIAALESSGALFLLVGWSIWVSHRHLLRTVRQALGPREEDEGAPMTYRTAWIGWIVSVAIFGGWMHTAGMSPVAVIAQMLFLFACYFGISKYAAATGFTFLSPAGAKGYPIIRSLFGTSALTPASQSMMILLDRNVFLGVTIRTSFVVAIPHTFKMLGKAIYRSRHIWIILLLAYVCGYALSGSSRLYRAYTEGGMNGLLNVDAMSSLARNIPYIEGSRFLYFDWQKASVWLFGVGEAAVLTILRTRFTWWPLHPLAVAFPERRYVFAIFIVWLAKSLTMRFGGVALYRRSLPLVYGLVCGYLAGIMVSSVIDAIWFPSEGHFVHGF